jgi:predicted naringenin-chalcone synthase
MKKPGCRMPFDPMTTNSRTVTTILDVETANPPHSLTQAEVFSGISREAKLDERALRLYRRFLSDEGISRRYFAWDNLPALLSETVDQKMKRFEHWAVRLSVEAVEKLFVKWDGQPSEIDALFVVTCTGYLCPGLSTYVSERLGLRPDVYTLDLVGLGCVGAMPALRAADHFLSCHPNATVAVVAVEVCSAAIHWDQKPELILSNSIFSDGAAAVLLSNRPQSRGLAINRISSVLWPQFREQLRFRYLDARLCNVISSQVPSIAAQAVEALYGHCNSEETDFAFHAGGRKVLDHIQDRLVLSNRQMEPSREILKHYGNMSSPSVLFALKNIFASGVEGERPVVCFSFGAGFLAYILQGHWQI